ncbi:bile acid:sodium symporter family protein [Saccharicrinis sp. FJH62]|uniref:bile acid:sodium symporter family protein n=1 Tax=Saccharicrinis sp. FJH62 TaxID=3344657 RepID=UPI0035D5203A
MEKLQRVSLITGFISILIIALTFLFKWDSFLAPAAVAASVLLAFGMGSVKVLKPYQYTAWIIAAIVCGLMYPSAFLKWGDFDLRNKWVILIVIQVVMFGMGTQMSLKDFTGIRTMGKGVLVGIICQFSIMPLTGYMLTRVFNFEPEIAAGVILIGSCSSGLASNVMVYLANANLTLSVTLTAVATLLAPIMTPFMMKLLAGTYIEINFWDMCIQIIKIVIVPIGAAMLYDAYNRLDKTVSKRLNIAFGIAVFWIIANSVVLWKLMARSLSPDMMRIAELLNFLAGAVIAGKMYYHLTLVIPKLGKLMPKLSMFGIVYFTLVTTAASRDNILAIGIFMLLASVMHNSLGYSFGYLISRALGLDKDSCRTVALEVGLQNGGMATGLAGVMGKLATVGLASAIFSPWMNISGSLLANYWRKRKEKGMAFSNVENSV